MQDFSSFFWSDEEINQRLERKLSLRTAAFVIGCSRVLEARLMRGLYP